jgi:hypothetical protein
MAILHTQREKDRHIIFLNIIGVNFSNQQKYKIWVPYRAANFVVATLGIIKTAASIVEVSQTQIGLCLVAVDLESAQQPLGRLVHLAHLTRYHAQA